MSRIRTSALDIFWNAELRRTQDLAAHHVAHAMIGEEALPPIGLQLLDAEREAAVLRLNAENDSLYLLTLLHHFRRPAAACGVVAGWQTGWA